MSNQYRIIERIFLNACDGLLCQSELQRELYAKDFVRIPAAVIPLGAQIHCTTSTGTVANNPPIKKKVAYIGNCFNYVDSNVILDALSLFNGLGVTLLWIGLQESEQERIKNDARIRGIDALCDLRGWMPHQSMIELLRNEAGAGIVLYKPSLHIAMVSPTKIFDYFAAGLPVIGPNMPSVANYVRNGEEGVLYESENALSLAEALETVFENETTYHKMRAHATAAAKKCSWENRADALRSFVDKFI
jgi:glycosyltransferase involved in cell wall biosynthesis